MAKNELSLYCQNLYRMIHEKISKVSDPRLGTCIPLATGGFYFGCSKLNLTSVNLFIIFTADLPQIGSRNDNQNLPDRVSSSLRRVWGKSFLYEDHTSGSSVADYIGQETKTDSKVLNQQVQSKSLLRRPATAWSSPERDNRYFPTTLRDAGAVCLCLRLIFIQGKRVRMTLNGYYAQNSTNSKKMHIKIDTIGTREWMKAGGVAGDELRRAIK